MEKEVAVECPKCRERRLNVYFEDGAKSPIGAKCDSCGFTGLFMKEELVQFAEL